MLILILLVLVVLLLLSMTNKDKNDPPYCTTGNLATIIVVYGRSYYCHSSTVQEPPPSPHPATYDVALNVREKYNGTRTTIYFRAVRTLGGVFLFTRVTTACLCVDKRIHTNKVHSSIGFDINSSVSITLSSPS